VISILKLDKFIDVRPDLHLAYIHWRKVEKQLNTIIEAISIYAVQPITMALCLNYSRLKFSYHVYFMRYYDLFDFTLLC